MMKQQPPMMAGGFAFGGAAAPCPPPLCPIERLRELQRAPPAPARTVATPFEVLDFSGGLRVGMPRYHILGETDKNRNDTNPVSEEEEPLEGSELPNTLTGLVHYLSQLIGGEGLAGAAGASPSSSSATTTTYEDPLVATLLNAAPSALPSDFAGHTGTRGGGAAPPPPPPPRSPAAAFERLLEVLRCWWPLLAADALRSVARSSGGGGGENQCHLIPAPTALVEVHTALCVRTGANAITTPQILFEVLRHYLQPAGDILLTAQLYTGNPCTLYPDVRCLTRGCRMKWLAPHDYVNGSHQRTPSHQDAYLNGWQCDLCQRTERNSLRWCCPKCICDICGECRPRETQAIGLVDSGRRF